MQRAMFVRHDRCSNTPVATENVHRPVRDSLLLEDEDFLPVEATRA
jgi:hypothetical protein